MANVKYSKHTEVVQNRHINKITLSLFHTTTDSITDVNLHY